MGGMVAPGFEPGCSGASVSRGVRVFNILHGRVPKASRLPRRRDRFLDPVINCITNNAGRNSESECTQCADASIHGIERPAATDALPAHN